MQELDHQTGETLECSGDSHAWVDLDQDALRSVDEYLQSPGLVDG